MANLVNGTYEPKEQHQFVAERGTSTHYRREIIDIKRIDQTWPSSQILKHIRATYMPGFSPPYMEIEGVRIDLVPHWVDEAEI